MARFLSGHRRLTPMVGRTPRRRVVKEHPIRRLSSPAWTRQLKLLLLNLPEPQRQPA